LDIRFATFFPAKVFFGWIAKLQAYNLLQKQKKYTRHDFNDKRNQVIIPK
jgi:hypothetical protein